MQKHKGWNEAQIRQAIRQTTPGVRDILAFVASNPGCITSDISNELGLKSHRSVGPTLNALTQTAIEIGATDEGEARWFFEYPGRVNGRERYDFPDWVRRIVQDELGHI